MTDIWPVLVSVQGGLPVLLLHVAATVALWLAGWRLMLLLVPEGQGDSRHPSTAAIGILRGGESLALAIPLSACLLGSINATDILVWGSVVVLMQLMFSFASRRFVSRFETRIHAGDVGLALSVTLARTGFAIINGAAVSG